MHKDFYIYEWYIEETGHVFYVGKGRLKSFKELHNRNRYFKNIYNKYKCNVRKIKEGLTNEEACQEEIKQIAFRKEKGEAECNFTLGGEGFSSGYLNPMYGVHMTGEENPFYGGSIRKKRSNLYLNTERAKAAGLAETIRCTEKGLKVKITLCMVEPE